MPRPRPRIANHTATRPLSHHILRSAMCPPATSNSTPLDLNALRQYLSGSVPWQHRLPSNATAKFSSIADASKSSITAWLATVPNCSHAPCRSQIATTSTLPFDLQLVATSQQEQEQPIPAHERIIARQDKVPHLGFAFGSWSIISTINPIERVNTISDTIPTYRTIAHPLSFNSPQRPRLP